MQNNKYSGIEENFGAVFVICDKETYFALLFLQHFVDI